MTRQDILIQKLQIESVLNALDSTTEQATKAEVLIKYFDRFFRPAQIRQDTFDKLLRNCKVESIFPPDTIGLDNKVVLQVIDPENIGTEKIKGISRLIDNGERIEFFTQLSGIVVRPTPLTIIYLNGLAEANELTLISAHFTLSPKRVSN